MIAVRGVAARRGRIRPVVGCVAESEFDCKPVAGVDRVRVGLAVFDGADVFEPGPDVGGVSYVGSGDRLYFSLTDAHLVVVLNQS